MTSVWRSRTSYLHSGYRALSSRQAAFCTSPPSHFFAAAKKWIDAFDLVLLSPTGECIGILRPGLHEVRPGDAL